MALQLTDERNIEINGRNYDLTVNYSVFNPGEYDAEIEIDSMVIKRPNFADAKLPYLHEVENDIKQELLDAVQSAIATQGLKAYATQ